MGSPYGPILTGIGLLDSGKLTPAGRAAYIASVIGLLAAGNDQGKGFTKFLPVSLNNLIPVPPIPGPSIPNITTLSVEPLFWFKPDPIAALMATLLVDATKTPTWNRIFVDFLYTQTAEALDISGATPLFPIFDFTAAFPNLVSPPFPLAIPDLALKLSITPPKLLIKLASLSIQLKLPIPPIPPIPPLPTLELLLPGISPLPSIGLPPLVLPSLLIGLLEIPLKVILQLTVPPNLSIVMDLIQFKFDAVFALAFNIMFQLLVDLGLVPIVPKLIVASLLVWLMDVVSMICVDIVGQLVGAGGSLTKAVGTILGLCPPGQ